MTILVVMAKTDKLSNYPVAVYFHGYKLAEKRLHNLKKRTKRQTARIHHSAPRSMMYVAKKGEET
jgi:hypothetical protein